MNAGKSHFRLKRLNLILAFGLSLLVAVAVASGWRVASSRASVTPATDTVSESAPPEQRGEGNAPSRAEASACEAAAREQSIGSPAPLSNQIRSAVMKDDIAELHALLEKLQASHTRQDLEDLVAIAADPACEPVDRKLALELLGGLSDIEAVAMLADLAARTDLDAWVRGEALFTLSEIASKDPAAAGGTLALLSRFSADAHSEVRRSVADGCGLLRDAGAAPVLLGMLEDDSPVVRARSAWALSQIGCQDAVEPLCARLALERDGIEIVDALGVLGNPRAVPTLLGIVDSGDESDPRLDVAIIALGKIRDSRSVTSLTRVLESGNEYLAMLAAESLASHGSVDLLPALEKAARERKWQDPWAASQVELNYVRLSESLR